MLGKLLCGLGLHAWDQSTDWHQQGKYLFVADLYCARPGCFYTRYISRDIFLAETTVHPAFHDRTRQQAYEAVSSPQGNL